MMGERDDLKDSATIAELEAQLQRLRIERDRFQERARDLGDIAQEFVEWTAIALDAGGWETVFDIPGWKERDQRLVNGKHPAYLGHASAIRPLAASPEPKEGE